MTAKFRRSEVVSGAFVLAAIATFTVFAFKVEGLDLFGFARGEVVLCRSYFADIQGLQDGAQVAVAGKRVGTVRSIRIVMAAQSEEDVEMLRARDPAVFAALQAGGLRQVIEVEYALEDPTLRIATDSATVLIAQDGLLGRPHLKLEPGYWAASEKPRPIIGDSTRDGQPLVIASRSTKGMDELVRDADALLSRAVGFLDHVEQDLLSADNVSNAEDMLADLALTAKAARLLLDESNDSGLQRQLIAPLRAAVHNAGKVLDESNPKLQGLLDDLSAATAQLEPQISNLVADLIKVSAQVEPRLARMEGDVHSLLTSSQAMIDENRAELAETMRRMRRAMWQAEMALRQIRGNPSSLLFGAEGTDFNAQATDFTGLDVTGRARPFGQRDEGEVGGR